MQQHFRYGQEPDSQIVGGYLGWVKLWILKFEKSLGQDKSGADVTVQFKPLKWRNKDSPLRVKRFLREGALCAFQVIFQVAIIDLVTATQGKFHEGSRPKILLEVERGILVIEIAGQLLALPHSIIRALDIPFACLRVNILVVHSQHQIVLETCKVT